MQIKFAGCLFAALCLLTPLAVAQQTPPPTNPSSSDPQQQTPPPSTNQQTQTEKEKENAAAGQTGQQPKPGEQGTSNDRLFYALPNFLTMETKKQLPPLTVGQKFKVVTRGSFDPIQIPWYGFLALVSQAENSEPGFRQGWEGYGKRYGAAFADGTIENYMVGAVLPSLLHQDPRFYQLGHGSFWHRTGYAMSRNLITFRDQGGHQFNFSEVVGGAVAAAISTNTYHPKSYFTYRYNPSTGMTMAVFHPSERTLSNTASVWGTQYGYDTLTLVIKEFWPDIRRKIVHKRQGESTSTSPNH